MDHLAEAKRRIEGSGAEEVGWATYYALLAIAHVGVALVERMDKAAEDAELEAERKEQWQEYQARREMGTAL